MTSTRIRNRRLEKVFDRPIETIANAEAGTPVYYYTLHRAINGGEVWKF